MVAYFVFIKANYIGNVIIKDTEQLGSFAANQSVEALEEQAEASLKMFVLDKAERTDLILRNIEKDVQYAAKQLEYLFNNKHLYKTQLNMDGYIVNNRVFSAVEPENYGQKSQVFITSKISLSDDLKDSIAMTEQIDSLYKSIKKYNPNVSGINFILDNGLVRIFPWISIKKLPSENFDFRLRPYYINAKPNNNPEKKIVWKNPYLDAAGITG